MKEIKIKTSEEGNIVQEIEYKHLKANYPYTYTQLAACLSLEFGNVAYGDVWNYVAKGRLPEKFGGLKVNKIGKKKDCFIFIESDKSL